VLAALFDSVCGRFFIGEVAGESGGVLHRVLRDFHVEWPLLAAQTLNFCVVAYLLYRFAFKPLMGVIDERQKKITDGLQYADEMQRQLGLVDASRDKVLKEAANEARDIVDTARKNAETVNKQELEKLDREMEATRERERERIREEHAVAFAALQGEVAQVAVELAEKILTASKSADGRKSFTQQALKEILP
jgi:F-type H+-transporting ATPase subunit b